MQTALRKMGNSTGMILPRAILGEIGVTTGAAMELRVEEGKLIATPIRAQDRSRWSEAAADIAAHAEPDESAWQGFVNDDDTDLAW